MIGVSPSNPYEAPTNADLEIKTDQLSVAQCLDIVISRLQQHI